MPGDHERSENDLFTSFTVYAYLERNCKLYYLCRDIESLNDEADFLPRLETETSLNETKIRSKNNGVCLISVQLVTLGSPGHHQKLKKDEIANTPAKTQMSFTSRLSLPDRRVLVKI